MIMQILEAGEIMRHCRIDDTEELEYLTSLGASAEEVVEKYLNCTFEQIIAERGYVPQSIKHACYLIVADMYRNREASSQVVLNSNPALMALLRPHKKLAL